jgi:cell division protein ZapA
MAHVVVTIHGRKYRLNCAQGEETHLTELANDLEERVNQLHESFGDVGEMQLLVMASLMLADEAAQARLQLGGGRDSGHGPAAALNSQSDQAAFAAALNAAAERIEQVTKSLNQSLGDNIAVG